MSAVHPATGARAGCGEIAAAVRAGAVTASAVVEAALARIAEAQPVLNAFTAVTAERARRQAAAIDRMVAAGGDPGPLAGVPFAVKNLFDVAGLATLAGSKIEADSPPAGADAPLVARLEAAGAVLVGALGMGEYAYDFTGRNAHYGPTRNPHDPARMTGGSSGGSGGAVAGGLVPLALGSDTNGSIRVPASLCGLFGLKPTFGRLTRRGSFPFVAALDHLGPLARSATDLALAYDAMQGPDAEDPHLAGRPPEPAAPLGDIAGLRIAVLDGHFVEFAGPDARAAVDAAAAALGAIRRVTLAEAGRARAAAYVITAAEGGALHLDRLRRRADDFDPETRDRLTAGALIPAAWVSAAQRFRGVFRRQVAEAMHDVDVLIAAATPCTAPAIDQQTMELAGAIVPVRANLGVLTQPISFIGLPVVAAPIARDGMPIAVQLIGRPWEEATVLRVAAALERMGVAAAPVAEGWRD
ncbi:amidase [Allostella vacuolata]|nr:amidase [Stella vacuolata]